MLSAAIAFFFVLPAIFAVAASIVAAVLHDSYGAAIGFMIAFFLPVLIAADVSASMGLGLGVASGFIVACGADPPDPPPRNTSALERRCGESLRSQTRLIGIAPAALIAASSRARQAATAVRQPCPLRE